MPRGFHFFRLILPALALLLLFPLHDTLPGGALVVYSHSLRLFQQGYLARSQREAELGYAQFKRSSPYWASQFQLLRAGSMLYRGMYDDALSELASYRDSAGPEGMAEKLAIEAVALTRQNQLPAARNRLARADEVCCPQSLVTCGEVLSAHAIFAIKNGQLNEARQHFLDALVFARQHNDRWLEAAAKLNIGYIAMQLDHYDEAVGWSRSAYADGSAAGYKSVIQGAAGNLGWAYYLLGDNERALEQFRQAETSAEELGIVRFQLKWLSTEGYIYEDSGDLARALDAYRKSLLLAKQIDSKEDTVSVLEDLAFVSVQSGQLAETSGYIDQIAQIEGAGHQSVLPHHANCMLAAARHQNAQAESCFNEVWDDKSALVRIRLDAGYRLAGLFEDAGDTRRAEEMYRSTLQMFETARTALKSEESQLPFGANASRIYDGYIQLLMREGKSEEALAVADESRAVTLERALDSDSDNSSKPVRLIPRLIARNTNATLLFYWLGEKQSYLWTITPSRIAAFTLPPQREIAERVKSYNKRILELRDPRSTGDADGEALYKSLIAPASESIRNAKQVVVLADGELSQLNFETLLVPGGSSNSQKPAEGIAQVHYLVDDLTLVSAPSLSMLETPMRARNRGGKMLLLGDPVSPNVDFPSLPLFGFEMNKIQSHFAKSRVSVVAGQQATPATYLSSDPAQYSYIHFVSHAVANRIVPLDSAIVLSRSSADENSFKLYARDIIQHPIDARLVTISACYGSGTRFYAGEGLVGLSWAFLHAGAQQVVGALWEVSDESTPRLMDGLYRGIEEGNSPAASLRNAKLSLLHSQSRFSLPFYWAAFQIYNRH